MPLLAEATVLTEKIISHVKLLSGLCRFSGERGSDLGGRGGHRERSRLSKGVLFVGYLVPVRGRRRHKGWILIAEVVMAQAHVRVEPLLLSNLLVEELDLGLANLRRRFALLFPNRAARSARHNTLHE